MLAVPETFEAIEDALLARAARAETVPQPRLPHLEDYRCRHLRWCRIAYRSKRSSRHWTRAVSVIEAVEHALDAGSTHSKERTVAQGATPYVVP